MKIMFWGDMSGENSSKKCHRNNASVFQMGISMVSGIHMGWPEAVKKSI
jgi:hypothetical protein